MPDGQIPNASGFAVRQDIIEELQGVRSCFTGPTEPVNPEPGMLWVDTSVNPTVVRQRKTGNDGWNDMFRIVGGVLIPANLSDWFIANLNVASAAAARTGLSLGAGATAAKATQAQALAGTDNDAFMTALRVSQAIADAAVGTTVVPPIDVTGESDQIIASGIGTGVRRANLTFTAVSTVSQDDWYVRLRTSTGPHESGYIGGSGIVGLGTREEPDGFVVRGSSPSRQTSGAVTLLRHGNTNRWAIRVDGSSDNNNVIVGGGMVLLPANLTGISVHAFNGDTFDNGFAAADWS